MSQLLLKIMKNRFLMQPALHSFLYVHVLPPNRIQFSRCRIDTHAADRSNHSPTTSFSFTFCQFIREPKPYQVARSAHLSAIFT